MESPQARYECGLGMVSRAASRHAHGTLIFQKNNLILGKFKLLN